MSHLPPSTAIFSPSVARLAASTARDWNYIDSWLSTKFHGHKPPAFERNLETLKALLALATLNEQADEERDIVARAEAAALQELKAASKQEKDVESGTGGEGPMDAILAAIEMGLSKEGKAALDSMAALAVQTGTAYPEPEHLAQRIVELEGQSFSLEQTAERIKIMQRFLDEESEKTEARLREVGSDAYKPPSDLAKRNLDMQRKIKTMAAGLPELGERLASDTRPGPGTHVTVEKLAKQEEEYNAILYEKKDIDSQLSLFQGLPHDTNKARAELESLRDDLRRLTRRRDAVFEELVERETPRKVGR